MTRTRALLLVVLGGLLLVIAVAMVFVPLALGILAVGMIYVGVTADYDNKPAASHKGRRR